MNQQELDALLTEEQRAIGLRVKEQKHLNIDVLCLIFRDVFVTGYDNKPGVDSKLTKTANICQSIYEAGKSEVSRDDN